MTMSDRELLDKFKKARINPPKASNMWRALWRAHLILIAGPVFMGIYESSTGRPFLSLIMAGIAVRYLG